MDPLVLCIVVIRKLDGGKASLSPTESLGTRLVGRPENEARLDVHGATCTSH